MDKDIFYVSLFLIVIGVGGQLAWIAFGGIPCTGTSQPYLLGASCDKTATQASFQELENVTGYAMLIGLILLPAGLFKDGLPSPGTGAKVFIGVILIIFVGVGFTSLLLLPSGHAAISCATTKCAVVTILPGSFNPPTGSTFKLTFSPENITVVLGVNNTVEWVNNDTEAHSILGDSFPAMNSQPFGPHTDYVYTFTQVGYFPYRCGLHPAWMFGSVTVKP
jgi:hypothetical protein